MWSFFTKYFDMPQQLQVVRFEFDVISAPSENPNSTLNLYESIIYL